MAIDSTAWASPGAALDHVLDVAVRHHDHVELRPGLSLDNVFVAKFAAARTRLPAQVDEHRNPRTKSTVNNPRA